MFALCSALAMFAAPAPASDAVAIIYVYPQDADKQTLLSRSELEQRFNGPIKKFWSEQSYGRYAPDATVFTWQMPITTATMLAGRQHHVVDTLKATLPNGDLAVPGYDPGKFRMTQILLGGDFIGFGGGMGRSDLKVNGVQHSGLAVGSYTYFNTTSKYETMLRFGYHQPGQAFKGRKNAETTNYPELGLWDSDNTLLHEWGHGLGLSTHALSWRSTVEPMYGDIYWSGSADFWNQQYDYGNAFDIMGGSIKYALHINAFYKDLLGWLAPAEKQVVTTTRRDVRLAPLESQTAGTVKAVQIPATGLSRPAPFNDKLDYAFYVEYRRPLGFDKHLAHPYLAGNTDGLFVYMTRRQGSGLVASFLLDMSPDDAVYGRSPTLVVPSTFANEDDNHLAALVPGTSFYDDQTGWALTDVRPDGDKGVTFDVEQGKKPGVASGVYTTALLGGQSLGRVGELRSSDLAYVLKVQGDGNLVVRRASDGGFVWGSAGAGVPMNGGSDKLEMKDGDLVLSAGNTRVWSSNTGGNVGARFVVGADGKPSVRSAAGAVLWPKPGIKENSASCRAGMKLLQDNMYKYPARPDAAPAGKLSWSDAYGGKFKPNYLAACDAVGKYIADNKGDPKLAAVVAAEAAAGGWANLFMGRVGIVAMGDRILGYCPNLHRSQFDCVSATDPRIRGASAQVLAILDLLDKT